MYKNGHKHSKDQVDMKTDLAFCLLLYRHVFQLNIYSLPVGHRDASMPVLLFHDLHACTMIDGPGDDLAGNDNG